MKVVFLGAGKGMGRALTRAMAQRGAQLFLLGRDLDDLRRSAADLEILGAASPVGAAFCDLLQPQTFAPALDAATAHLGDVDTVVITAGLFATQDELEADAQRTERLLTANFTNTILFAEAARRRLLARGGGTLCVFSSVAGERGRKPVILYGAAKAGLSRYLEGLDHKFRAQGLHVVTVKPGFVATKMTEGMELPGLLTAKPEQIAKAIFKAYKTKKGTLYYFPVWRQLMFIIRNVPEFVFVKTKL